MTTLVLLLASPLQAWGVRSLNTSHRDTHAHPTRSGIIGLLAASLGLERETSPEWAEGLSLAVRIDRPGLLLTDFHTVGGGYPAGRGLVAAQGKPREHASVSRRDYLADAAFVVAIHSPDRALAERIIDALRRPTFTPFLGRKAFPPSLPPLLGTTTELPLAVLNRLPAYGGGSTGAGTRSEPRTPSQADALATVDFDALLANTGPISTTFESTTLCRVVVEDPEYATATLNDVPGSFDHWNRTYTFRRVGEETVQVPTAGTGHRGWAQMRDALAVAPAINTGEGS